jgi:beta-glucosidase
LLKVANVHALPGDVTNWMNQTSGAFNYTGLVANMEMKAGSFYGMFPKPGF